MRKTLLIVVAVIVVCVAGMVVYAQWFTDTKQRFTASLSKVVPSELPGWEIEEVPLAESQGQLENVEKVLKYDQYVSRKYSKGDLEITLYAAYWKPGKRSPIDAGGHNPDSCWVNFGWTRTLREYSITGTKIDGRELLPYEYGVYEKDGAEISAMFWHLLNGKPHAYKDHRDGWKDGIAGVIFRLPKRIEDFKRFGLNQRREQLFIRISFNGKNFDKVLENPDFAEFMEKISGLGIFCDSAWSDDVPIGSGCGAGPHPLSLPKGGDHDNCPALAGYYRAPATPRHYLGEDSGPTEPEPEVTDAPSEKFLEETYAI